MNTMQLKLAYAPISCSLVPYVLLTEVQANFETLVINMAKGDHLSPSYLQLNPKGKVPTLIINGQALSENLAIQLWIAEQFPQFELLPTDPFERANAVSVMSFCSSGIHPKLTQQARPERYCSLPDSAPSVQSLGSESLLELFAIADKMLEGREWFVEKFSCADAYFYWCFRRGSMFKGDTSIFSNCVRHLKQMETRPSVQKLLAFEKEVQKSFEALK
jgi:glutathione S-transferase